MKINYKEIDSEKYKYELTSKFMKYVKIHDYSFLNKYIWITPEGGLMLGSGYQWDGCSGPTIDDKTNMQAGLVHDALYQLIRERGIPLSKRKEVDLIFYRLLIEDGMNPIRAKIYYLSVRLFGKRYCKPQE